MNKSEYTRRIAKEVVCGLVCIGDTYRNIPEDEQIKFMETTHEKANKLVKDFGEKVKKIVETQTNHEINTGLFL